MKEFRYLVLGVVALAGLVMVFGRRPDRPAATPEPPTVLEPIATTAAGGRLYKYTAENGTDHYFVIARNGSPVTPTWPVGSTLPAGVTPDADK